MCVSGSYTASCHNVEIRFSGIQSSIMSIFSGPAVVPQYYGVQTPWGIYPAAGILQQQPGAGAAAAGQQTPQPVTPQQQLLRAQTNNARPVTPQSDALGTPTGSVQPSAIGTPSKILHTFFHVCFRYEGLKALLLHL